MPLASFNMIYYALLIIRKWLTIYWATM